MSPLYFHLPTARSSTQLLQILQRRPRHIVSVVLHYVFHVSRQDDVEYRGNDARGQD